MPEPPPVECLNGVPPEAYADASAAELQLWRLLQSDDDLVQALTRLRPAKEAAPGSPPIAICGSSSSWSRPGGST